MPLYSNDFTITLQYAHRFCRCTSQRGYRDRNYVGVLTAVSLVGQRLLRSANIHLVKQYVMSNSPRASLQETTDIFENRICTCRYVEHSKIKYPKYFIPACQILKIFLNKYRRHRTQIVTSDYNNVKSNGIFCFKLAIPPIYFNSIYIVYSLLMRFRKIQE